MDDQQKPKTKDSDNEDLKWENPKNPENASDKRDEEQFNRQKEEAERRKENLSTI